MRALLRPLHPQPRFVPVVLGDPAGGAERDRWGVQGVDGVPPAGGDEERLALPDDLLRVEGVLEQRELGVVRVVAVHLGVHLLAMVKVRSHLRGPQLPQLAALDVSVEEGNGVKVEGGFLPLCTEPEVGLVGVNTEKAVIEGLHVLQQATGLFLVQQVVVSGEVQVVLIFVLHDVVDELSKVHVPPEQVLLGLEILIFGTALLHVDSEVPIGSLQPLWGPVLIRFPLWCEVGQDNWPTDIEIILEILRRNSWHP
mmetsp:Transcript_39550/g.86147  ORF Transcript_39550/g.86147 Transcript_39550/m.86147 type:complete len:254 (+) Transcript_39550:1322-2083(+)